MSSPVELNINDSSYRLLREQIQKSIILETYKNLTWQQLMNILPPKQAKWFIGISLKTHYKKVWVRLLKLPYETRTVCIIRNIVKEFRELIPCNTFGFYDLRWARVKVVVPDPKKIPLVITFNVTDHYGVEFLVPIQVVLDNECTDPILEIPPLDENGHHDSDAMQAPSPNFQPGPSFQTNGKGKFILTQSANNQGDQVHIDFATTETIPLENHMENNISSITKFGATHVTSKTSNELAGASPNTHETGNNSNQINSSKKRKYKSLVGNSNVHDMPGSSQGKSRLICPKEEEILHVTPLKIGGLPRFSIRLALKNMPSAKERREQAYSTII